MPILGDISESSNAILQAQANFEEAERRLRGHEHVQTTPATVWTVTHNLGYRPASFSLWLDNRAAFTSVEHVDDNTLTLRFRSAKTGLFKCH